MAVEDAWLTTGAAWPIGMMAAERFPSPAFPGRERAASAPDQVCGVEPLAEPAIDPCSQVAGPLAPALCLPRPGHTHRRRSTASAGIPGFNLPSGLSSAISTRNTILTRSSWVWTFLGVNSASLLMCVDGPAEAAPGVGVGGHMRPLAQLHLADASRRHVDHELDVLQVHQGEQRRARQRHLSGMDGLPR